MGQRNSDSQRQTHSIRRLEKEGFIKNLSTIRKVSAKVEWIFSLGQ